MRLGSTFARPNQCLEAILDLLFQPGRQLGVALAVIGKGVSQQFQQTGKPPTW